MREIRYLKKYEAFRSPVGAGRRQEASKPSEDRLKDEASLEAYSLKPVRYVPGVGCDGRDIDIVRGAVRVEPPLTARCAVLR